MRLNEDGLEKTVDYLRSLGVEKIGIDTIRPTGRGVDPDLRPRRWANEKTSPDLTTNCCGEELSFNSCWSGKTAVTSRGSVIPCIFSRDKVAGDLRRRLPNSHLSPGFQALSERRPDRIPTFESQKEFDQHNRWVLQSLVSVGGQKGDLQGA